MSTRHRLGVKSQVLVGMALAALVAIGLWAGPPAAAAPLEKLDSSMSWLPQDAAGYGTRMRLGEQIEKVCKSRAWARLKSLPAVQDALAKIGAAAKSGDNAAQIEAIRNNPEVKRGLDLLRDMFAREVFVYAGPEVIDAFELFQHVNLSMSYEPLLMMASGQEDAAGEGRAPLRIGMRTLVDKIELLKVPNFLIGFKVENRDRAVEAIGKLEGVLGLLSLAAPQIGQRVKRKAVGGQDYLTLELDGGMVPWDDVREEIEKSESRKGDADKLIAKLKKMTLSVALGVRGNYVLLLIGPSTDLLGRLGKEKSLAELPAFQPLEKFADREVIGVGYVSSTMAERVLDGTRQLRILAALVERYLPRIKVDDSQKDRIRKDLKEFLQDLDQVISKPGAMMSFAFATDRGIEVYAHRWASRFDLDDSKPLELLGHVGGNPILAVVGRSKVSPAQYDLAVKWLKVAIRYADQYAVPKMDSGDREMYEKVVGRLRPLAERLDQVNRTLILPALADGQTGLVLDAKLRSRQFHNQLPATERPMPMVEPALVLGVSNAEQLRKGFAEYRKLANELIDAIRELAPDANISADLKIPEPKQIETSVGTICVFPLPEEWGVAQEIAPSMGISAHVAAMAISQKHVERLLAETSPKFGGLLADPKQPRAAAVVFDWAGLVDAATPWVELAVRKFVPEDRQPGDGPKPEAKKPAAKKKAPKKPRKMSTLAQVRVVLGVLKTFRTVTSESSIQDGVMVTHSLIEIRDVDPPAAKKPAKK